MKFTKGYWLNLPGVENYDCVQIREVKVSRDQVYLYAVPYAEDERAVGGPALEIFLSSPRRDILRTQAYHFIGSGKKEPQFHLETEDLPLEVSEFEGGLTITSGSTSLRVTTSPASFTYYYKGKKLTNIGDRFGHAMLSTMQTPEGPFMRCQMDVDIGERLYGLGERFTPFVKNGQVVDMWNEDGGTCSEIAYKNIPFYLSSKGYGVLVNSSGKVSFELCSEVVTRAQFSLPGEKLDFMVVGGGDCKTALENYTALTGRPALPPAWSFGLWLTTSFTTSYDEKTVRSFVDGMAERDIPLHVFHFDCFWMKENEWCNFTWDDAMFDDAPAMLRRMKEERGLKICVWINPYIGQKSPPLQGGDGAGLPAQTSQRGRVAVGPVAGGPGGGGLYKSRRHRLVPGEAPGPFGPGRGLLQNRLRRAHPHRRGVLRRLRPGADAQLLRLPVQQVRLRPAGGVQGEGPGLPLRPQRHGGGPEVPRPLGRRLLLQLPVHGRVPPGRAVPVPVGLRLLEPRHLRL